MCVVGMSLFPSSSWESVCIGVLWHRGIVSQKRGFESKQVGIPLMSSSTQ